MKESVKVPVEMLVGLCVAGTTKSGQPVNGTVEAVTNREFQGSVETIATMHGVSDVDVKLLDELWVRSPKGGVRSVPMIVIGEGVR